MQYIYRRLVACFRCSCGCGCNQDASRLMQQLLKVSSMAGRDRRCSASSCRRTGLPSAGKQTAAEATPGGTGTRLTGVERTCGRAALCDSGLICRRELTGTGIRRQLGSQRRGVDTKLSCSRYADGTGLRSPCTPRITFISPS